MHLRQAELWICLNQRLLKRHKLGFHPKCVGVTPLKGPTMPGVVKAPQTPRLKRPQLGLRSKQLPGD